LPGSAKTGPVRPLEWRNAEGTFGPNGHNPIQVDKSIEKNQMARGLFQSPKVNLGPARFATGEIARSRGRKFFPPA